jgi:hypothetical protein
MKKARNFLLSVIALGLLLVLASCNQTLPPIVHLTPRPNPTPTVAQPPPPTLTPTPFGGDSATLGPLPHNCPPGPALIELQAYDGPFFAVGMFPVWGADFSGPHAMLEWTPTDAQRSHDSQGWGHKLIWIVNTAAQGLVTIHGANLQTGAPLFPDAQESASTSTATMMVLNPEDPSVTNRIPPWAEFPGGLIVPGAGCYYLEADWPGGHWRITFAAGVVPSYT